MAQGLRGFFLADADQLSALVAVELSMQPTDPGHVTLSRIKGGNDRLVQALAQTHGLKVALNVGGQADRSGRSRRARSRRGSAQERRDGHRRLPGADDAAADRTRSRVHARGARDTAARVAGAEARDPRRRPMCDSTSAGGARRAVRARGDRTSTPARSGRRRAPGPASLTMLAGGRASRRFGICSRRADRSAWCDACRGSASRKTRATSAASRGSSIRLRAAATRCSARTSRPEWRAELSRVVRAHRVRRRSHQPAVAGLHERRGRERRSAPRATSRRCSCMQDVPSTLPAQPHHLEVAGASIRETPD